MQIKNKRILIIGGAGFIGSHLASALINDNKVTSLDNYFTGSEENHISGVTYIRGDAKNIQDLFGNYEFDLVYHFGEYSRVEQSFDDYTWVIENNLGALHNVLEFCRAKHAKLIYSGSSTKFADKNGNGDASPYAWTKRVNTEHIINYSRWFDLNYAIVYFYNLYGGNEIKQGKYSTVVAKFKELYKEGLPLTVVEPGTQLRNFTYYADTVNALITVGLLGQGDNYGIGSHRSYSVVELANMFGSQIEYLPARSGNRLTAELNIEKTLALGWQPQMDLATHIADWKLLND